MLWTILSILGGIVISIIVFANIYSFHKTLDSIRKYPMTFRDMKNLIVYNNVAKITDSEIIFGDENAGLYIALRNGAKYRHDDISTAYIITNKVPYYFYMIGQHREELLAIARKSIGDKLKEKIELNILNKAVEGSMAATKALEGNVVGKVNMEKN